MSLIVLNGQTVTTLPQNADIAPTTNISSLQGVNISNAQTNQLLKRTSNNAFANGFVDYSELTGVPTNIATTQYVNTQIANAVSDLIDGAPTALDTLNELADALNDNASFASTITQQLATKANTADLATVATSGDYNDLSNTPTVPTDVSTLADSTNRFFSGSYTDLTNTPTIPTATSDLTNDSGFITALPSTIDGGTF